MKNNLSLLLLLLLSIPVLAQKLFHARIDKTELLLRGAPVVLGQVTIMAPSAGKVMVRFDGDCISSVGDRIFLAASKTQNWGGSDNSVIVKAISTDLNSNVFSHTRVYDVAAGPNTFYAVAENYSETAGNGKASIYGSLTVEWFPEIPGQAFVRHKGIVQTNFNVEGAPVILTEQTINAPTAGKVVVRFDGLCLSSDGDLIFLAASNTPGWSSNDGSSSIEIVDNEFNRNSFAHVRTYDVTPGNHTYYAVIENFYEIYGNGIASVFGSLTVEYYPESSPVIIDHQAINQIGVSIEGAPVTLSEITLNSPTAGKVILNFAGTCLGSFGDYIKLAVSDTPNWNGHDESIGFEPFSSDRNRTSFSHTREYEVEPGEHHYYAVAQNVLEFFGSGLAVVYGSFDLKFYPNESVLTSEPNTFQDVCLMPNPATDLISITLGEMRGFALEIVLLDGKGTILKTFQREANDLSAEINVDVSGLVPGVYFIKLSNSVGSAFRKFVRL